MISIDWTTKVITVPQSYLTPVSGSLFSLDINTFRLDLRNMEAGEGITFDETHAHTTEQPLNPVILARFVEIINGYTITFENGSYVVDIVGGNTNFLDVLNVNSVSVRSNNSAGMIKDPAQAVWEYDITNITQEETAGKHLRDSEKNSKNALSVASSL